MSDHDPRDWGYTQYRKGYYYKSNYMKEFGSNVWQPLVTIGPTTFLTPEPFVTEKEAIAFLQGVIYAHRGKELEENNDEGGQPATYDQQRGNTRGQKYDWLLFESDL